MKYSIFTYHVPPPQELKELNSFLASQKILSVKSHVIQKQEIPYIIFIVEYMESVNNAKGAPKIDYRETLSDQNFQIFSKLRDYRKTIAARDGVPVYAIFTNAQLAEIVGKKVIDEKALSSIQGVGDARIKKYGKDFVAFCQELMSDNNAGNT